jgi:hypothetical protein
MISDVIDCPNKPKAKVKETPKLAKQMLLKTVMTTPKRPPVNKSKGISLENKIFLLVTFKKMINVINPMRWMINVALIVPMLFDKVPLKVTMIAIKKPIKKAELLY